MAMKKKELQKELKKMGIEFPEDSKVTELKKMYDDGVKQSGNDSYLDEKDDTTESTEEGVEERSKQASLVECMRQANGKKPFKGSGLEEV